jgi:uncharacterized protein
VSSWRKPEAPANDACAPLRLGGLELVPDLSGALFIPDYSALVVADLHFEKATSFARRGFHLPPFDTRSTLSLLGEVICRRGPERLIALGDSLHDGLAASRIADADLASIRNLAECSSLLWVAGNHDPKPARGLPGAMVKEVRLGTLVLRHVPRKRLQGELEIAGHLHPVASVSRRGQRLRGRCFIADDRRLVLPAFGAFTGGRDVRASEIIGLFENGCFRTWIIGRRAIYSFPSAALC